MKQVIVVNEALNLPPGKMAAQVAHAAVGGLLHASHDRQSAWLEAGMPKVVLRCENQAALLELAAQAQAAGLPTMLVRDAGRTVVEAGTATCVGIGPDDPARIDAITGTLKLAR
jgi:peptidyl-tRNA hydrolase